MGKYELRDIPKARLSDRHRELVRHYFECGMNKTEACRRAGYARPKEYSQQVFNSAGVKAEIQRYRDQMTKQTELTVEWLVERLMAVADAGIRLARFKKVNEDGTLYWDFTGATPEELAIIESITSETYVEGRGKNAKDVKRFKVGISDPLRALDMLVRMQGGYNDKVTVAGELDLVARLNRGRQRVAEAAQKEESDEDV